MEKIVLSNQHELQISSISKDGNLLNIKFQNGDMQVLEEVFLNQANLEKIILKDVAGTAMSVFNNFTILKIISKEKSVLINEVNNERVDLVTITLEQENEWIIENRKLKEQLLLHDGAISDLGNVISDLAEGGSFK